jgi:hypothetical protein
MTRNGLSGCEAARQILQAGPSGRAVAEVLEVSPPVHQRVA